MTNTMRDAERSSGNLIVIVFLSFSSKHDIHSLSPFLRTWFSLFVMSFVLLVSFFLILYWDLSFDHHEELV